MPSLHRSHRLAAVAGVCLAVSTLAASSPASAHNTVVFDDAGAAAPHIGLIGDSTLAGVRWSGKYGDLRQYNFVLDAESCRRTLEQSCWSREDFRPDNTVLAVQRLAGELGEVLVVMSGYNDKRVLFDDAVDAVVAEAQRQAIPHVMWLTLRTDDVTYQDPQERASADGYREDNRVLYEKAEQLGGYLQIADWATHSAGRSDWFFGDGVHLTTDGVSALTTFIADHVGVVLAGGSLNPEVAPWATLEEGDSGPTVADVQEALLAAGISRRGRRRRRLRRADHRGSRRVPAFAGVHGHRRRRGAHRHRPRRPRDARPGRRIRSGTGSAGREPGARAHRAGDLRAGPRRFRPERGPRGRRDAHGCGDRGSARSPSAPPMAGGVRPRRARAGDRSCSGPTTTSSRTHSLPERPRGGRRPPAG